MNIKEQIIEKYDSLHQSKRNMRFKKLFPDLYIELINYT